MPLVPVPIPSTGGDGSAMASSARADRPWCALRRSGIKDQTDGGPCLWPAPPVPHRKDMTVGTVWGIVMLVLGLVGWGGQTISWLAPGTAVRLGLMEDEEDVEAAYFADVRGEATWDALTLWTLVIAGALLVADNPAWAPFGLVGGAMYVYFAGRGILTRVVMLRRGLRVGAPAQVPVNLAMLAVWGVMGIVTIVAAAVALPPL